MSKIDFDAHAHLGSKVFKRSDVQSAIAKANEKAHMGHFLVCVTNAGDVLVLPEFSASVRDDISETVYSNLTGYIFKAQQGAN